MMPRHTLPLLLVLSALVTGCALPPAAAPPYLALLTPLTHTTPGMCTGVIIGPREVVTAKHCNGVWRVVTATGQEAWVVAVRVSATHDVAVLTTDRTLWVSEYAEFAEPELGVLASMWGYCPHQIASVARHAYYNGLVTMSVQGGPEYAYGQWFMVFSEVCGGDSGLPMLQRGKVVGLFSAGTFPGVLAYTVPVEFVTELIAHE